MTAYEVDYVYYIEEFGTHIVNADSIEEAEMLTKSYVNETYPEGFDLVIEQTKEIK